MKSLAITTFTFLAVNIAVFASAPQQSGNKAIVEIGYCDRDIKPFLDDAALKWGKYFLKIYGECDRGHISIKIYSSGRYMTFEEIKKESYDFCKELALIYPLYSSKVTVIPSESEKSWSVIYWEIENGKVTTYQEN